MKLDIQFFATANIETTITKEYTFVENTKIVNSVKVIVTPTSDGVTAEEFENNYKVTLDGWTKANDGKGSYYKTYTSNTIENLTLTWDLVEGETANHLFCDVEIIINEIGNYKYTPTNWINDETSINQDRLNNIEEGIAYLFENGSGSGGATGDTLPIGTIMPFTSDSILTNWLLCDGQAVSRTTYAELFSLIGTTYGTGDGSTTFNVPDMRGYVPVGKDSDDTNINAIGKKYGEKTHVLTIDEMPEHSHDFGVSSTVGGQVQNQPGYGGELTFTQNVGNTGGDQPHNNMQPSMAVNYIIKAKNSVGLIGNVTDIYSESKQDSYSCNYVNGTWLYENNSGTAENITLNDEVEKYSRIKVLIGSSSSSYGVREVYPKPSYNSISLTGTFWIDSNGGSFTVGYLDLSINGKNVTINANRQCNFPQTNTNSGSVTTNSLKIYGIIGYK